MDSQFSWLREIGRMSLLYMAAGAAAVPFGLVYGLLVLNNWDHWVAVIALLGSGTLTAHLVWVSLDKRNRTRKTLESRRIDPAGIPARAEDSEHRVIPAFFVPSTPTSNYALLRYDLGVLSEIKIIAAPNTIIAHHVADGISIRVADQSRVTGEVFIGTTVTQVGDVTWIMEPGQPLTIQSGPESRTSTPTAAGTLALVA